MQRLFIISYNNSGSPSVIPKYLPPGSYGNILCFIDMDGDNIIDSNDKYQIVSGPTILTLDDDSKSFSISSWSTL